MNAGLRHVLLAVGAIAVAVSCAAEQTVAFCPPGTPGIAIGVDAEAMPTAHIVCITYTQADWSPDGDDSVELVEWDTTESCGDAGQKVTRLRLGPELAMPREATYIVRTKDGDVRPTDERGTIDIDCERDRLTVVSLAEDGTIATQSTTRR